MATLQKFKLLATQCATAASSPSRSPLPASAAAAAAAATKSPSFHLRRRKTTLRRLLSRSSSSSSRRFLRRAEPSGASQAASDRAERKGLLSHTSLKDLFVSSSPSPPEPAGVGRCDNDAGTAEGSSGGHEAGYESPSAAAAGRGFGLEGIGGAAFAGRRSGGGFGARFGSTAALRYRLLKRAWRPVLLAIPE